MKKFLALAFVCAGLTAMAATPRLGNVNKADFTKKANTASSMIMKSNTFGKNLTASMVNAQMGDKQVSPIKFFKDRHLTPSDNALVKKAPRRITADDILAADYIDFRNMLTFNSEGYLTAADPYYVGGYGIYFKQEGDQLYGYGIYWDIFDKSSWLPMNIDYSAKTVSLPTGVILEDSTHTGKVTTSGTSQVRVDTVVYSFFANEDYFYGGSIADVTGVIYDDGTIQFNDSIGYVYAGYQALIQYSRRNQNQEWQQTSADTTEFYDIHRGTMFVVANGTHDYTYYSSQYYPNGVADNNNVYMFQDAMGTVSVWNLWGLGMPDVSMYVADGGVMEFPDQAIYDINDDACYDENGVMQGDGVIYNVTGTWANGNVSGLTAWGNTGTITEDQIEWGMTIPFNGHWVFGIGFGDNKLSYKNEADKFNIVMATAPEITSTVNADNVVVNATCADEGSVVLLLIDGARVEIPATLERRDTAYTVSATAGAYVPYEKNLSTATATIEIPAKVTVKIGDVNKDGNVNISDVTALIDALLSGNLDDTDTFSYDNSECNGDGTVNIADVTALIDMLLSGAAN